MKSDISRQTFNPRKHYNRVIMQQGRVQLDADWNEQQDILLHRLNTQTSDITGQGVVSADTDGFAVMFTPDGQDLIITPGSIYVEGLLCELEQETAIPRQSISAEKGTLSISRQDLDDAPFKKERWINHWIELLSKHEQSLGFLKITNVDDQDQQIITFSFGQPFPAKSNDIVKMRLVTTYLTQPHYPQPDPRAEGLPKLDTSDPNNVLLVYLDIWERQISAFNDPDIVEVALGGVDTGQRSQTLWQVKIMPIKITSKELLEAIEQDTGTLSQAKQYALERNISRLLRVFTFSPPCSEWKAPLPAYAGRLSVHLADTQGNDVETYRGLENQLYHVEIHEGTKDSTIPTFKWARNNASSLVAVTIKDGQVMVQGSGQGSLLGLTVGQYVELLDESTELLGLPGHMAQIKQVNDITGLLTLNPPPPENTKQNRLRLWNSYAPIDGSESAQVSKDGWIALENGVEIQFTQGQDDTYRSGDYWQIPARPATGKIEWPHVTPQSPIGIHHHYTRLACLLHTQTMAFQQDCRAHFFPLTAQALHILDINWQNDMRYKKEDGHGLLREGLRIILDGSPDQECEKAMQAAMIVTVETALPGGGASIFLINGHFEIIGNVIRWHWNREEKEGLLAKFFSRFDEFRSRLFEKHPHHLCVRIKLLGHYIWHTSNGRHIYLDGQAFGKPGTQPSGHIPLSDKEPGPHIDLQFPSGAGHPASDFESWFYMQE